MGDSLDGAVETNTESQNVIVVDLISFSNYLRKAICILHPDELILHAFDSAVEDKNNQDCIRKFINDSQVWMLCIQRISSKG
jgi:dynein heavy chain 1